MAARARMPRGVCRCPHRKTVLLTCGACRFTTGIGVVRGSPFCCCTGWRPRATSGTWVAPLLAEDFRIAAMDQRGHGQSAQVDEGYDFGTVLGDAAAMIDHLGWERPIVVGHSWGADVGIGTGSGPSADGRWPDLRGRRDYRHFESAGMDTGAGAGGDGAADFHGLHAADDAGTCGVQRGGSGRTRRRKLRRRCWRISACWRTGRSNPICGGKTTCESSTRCGTTNPASYTRC